MTYLEQKINPKYPNNSKIYYSISNSDNIPSYTIAIHNQHLHVKDLSKKRISRIEELMELKTFPFTIITKEEWEKIVNKIYKKLNYENR